MNNKLLHDLNDHDLVSVTFLTKAKHVRCMRCTRRLSAIPENQHSGITDEKLNGPSICCVYDFLVHDWRSFRWDSVLSWKIGEL